MFVLNILCLFPINWYESHCQDDLYLIRGLQLQIIIIILNLIAKDIERKIETYAAQIFGDHSNALCCFKSICIMIKWIYCSEFKFLDGGLWKTYDLWVWKFCVFIFFSKVKENHILLRPTLFTMFFLYNFTKASALEPRFEQKSTGFLNRLVVPNRLKNRCYA